MAAEYAHRLGENLRSARRQQAMSRRDVEERSGGRWKAVVVGSWERADRNMTVANLAELADFYAVSLPELLPNSAAAYTLSGPRLVIDLQRLAQLDAEDAKPLARYAAMIKSERGDYGREVLTIRSSDTVPLAIIYDLSPRDLIDRLVQWKVLPADTQTFLP